MAIPIVTVPGKSIVNGESNTNDLIFNVRPTSIGKTPSHANIVIADFDYHRCDKKQFIFTNIRKESIYAVHANNLVTGVRYKKEFDTYIGKQAMMTAFSTKDDVSGIYVVDEFIIYNDGRCNFDELIQYYSSGCNVDISDNQQEYILRTIVSQEIKKPYDSIKLRIVTFVSEKELDKFSYIYVPSAGLAFTNCDLDKEFLNPMSSRYRDCSKSIMSDIKNSIVIDIVNNETKKPYYYRIGNRILRVLSIKDSSRENCAVMTVRKNGGAPKRYKVSLDGIHDLGIYETEDEALAGGNLALLVEREKINLEKEKLKTETYLLEQKVKIAQLDMSNKRLGFEFEKYKNVVTMTQLHTKFYMEITHMREKNKFEITKMSSDVIVKIATVVQTLYKLLK